MTYSDAKYDDSTPGQLFVEMFWVFVSIAVFFLIMGIGILRSSRVYYYEMILTEGIKAKELEIDFDYASKGREGRPVYS